MAVKCFIEMSLQTITRVVLTFRYDLLLSFLGGELTPDAAKSKSGVDTDVRNMGCDPEEKLSDRRRHLAASFVSNLLDVPHINPLPRGESASLIMTSRSTTFPISPTLGAPTASPSVSVSETIASGTVTNSVTMDPPPSPNMSTIGPVTLSTTSSILQGNSSPGAAYTTLYDLNRNPVLTLYNDINGSVTITEPVTTVITNVHTTVTLIYGAGQADSGGSKRGVPIGAIVGAVVGGVVLLGSIFGFLLWRRRKAQKGTPTNISFALSNEEVQKLQPRNQ